MGLLKTAAKVAGGRLNDAFLAATAAGLRRYHEEPGSPAAASGLLTDAEFETQKARILA